nr:polyprotein [Mute swan feces associated sapelovirus 2]
MDPTHCSHPLTSHGKRPLCVMQGVIHYNCHKHDHMRMCCVCWNTHLEARQLFDPVIDRWFVGDTCGAITHLSVCGFPNCPPDSERLAYHYRCFFHGRQCCQCTRTNDYWLSLLPYYEQEIEEPKHWPGFWIGGEFYIPNIPAGSFRVGTPYIRQVAVYDPVIESDMYRDWKATIATGLIQNYNEIQYYEALDMADDMFRHMLDNGRTHAANNIWYHAHQEYVRTLLDLYVDEGQAHDIFEAMDHVRIFWHEWVQSCPTLWKLRAHTMMEEEGFVSGGSDMDSETGTPSLLLPCGSKINVCSKMHLCLNGLAHWRCDRHSKEIDVICCHCLGDCTNEHVVRVFKYIDKLDTPRFSLSDMLCLPRNRVYADEILGDCKGTYDRVSMRRLCKARGGHHMVCKCHRDDDLPVCCICVNPTTRSHLLKVQRELVINPQGQVNSQQSGNTTTSTMAGGNVTNINYYGSQYTQPYQPTLQTMDPSKFTEPIAEVASHASPIPALQSPSAERCGYSDRVMQLTAGNATLITQESAAGAVISYGQWPTYADSSATAIDLPTRPGPSCDRWYTLDSISWTKTGLGASGESTYQYYRCPFPASVENLGVVGQNMQYHYLWRAGCAYHIQCNASKFHQGCLLVVVIPESAFQASELSTGFPQKWSNPTLTNNLPLHMNGAIQQLTLFPHQFINLRTNNSATIVYPFTNCLPVSLSLVHNPWTLWIIPIVPLDYSTGASTKVPITISMCPMSSQFSGLRNAVALPAAGQGIPTFQVPGSGQFMTTLRNEGYPAYPDFEKTHSFPLPGRVRNLSEIIQVGTFARLTQDASGINYRKLILSVSNNATNLANPIASWDMSLLSTTFEGTTLSRLSRMYANYRGSIKLNFMYCGAAMITGKLLISYTPPGGSQPTSRQEAMLSTHVVWDIGLQSTVSFTIPFISLSQYRNVNEDGNALSYNGYITLWYQTAMVAPANIPTESYIVCLVSGADDFVLRGPMDTAYYQGPGDTLQDAIQSATQGMLDTAVHGAINTGLGIDSTGSSALTAAETGVTQTDAGESTMALRPVTVSFSKREMDMEYLMSRHSLLEVFNLTSATSDDTGFKNIELTFGSISQYSSMLRTKYLMMTYWRADLEITVVVQEHNSSISPSKWQLMYVPVGGVTPSDASGNPWYSSNNPSIYFTAADPPANMRIPFMSAANYWCTRYDGYKDFDRTNNYGVAPGNVVGKLCIRSLWKDATTNTQQARVYVFVRPVNVEAYLPSPIQVFATAQSTSLSRHRVVVVESQPRDEAMADLMSVAPIEPQGPVLQGPLEWIKDNMQDMSKTLSAGFVDAIVERLMECEETNWGKTVMGWFSDVLSFILRLISSAVAIIKTNCDPIVVTTQVASLGFDFCTSDPVYYLKQKVCAYLKIAMPQGPTEWFKEFTAAINAARGFSWIIEKVGELISWIMKVAGFADAKQKERSRADVIMREVMAEWDKYSRGDTSEYSRDILAKKIIDLKDYVLDEKCTPSFSRLYNRYFLEATRYLKNDKDRKFEPIGVVFRGTPGCGKSILTQMMGHKLMKILGDERKPYSLPPDPKYFDNYDHQAVVIMDDLGQNPDGEDFKHFCQMISPVNYIVPMADVSDKGVQFTSSVVLASTNLMTFSPPTITEPAAVARRLMFDLEVTICGEFDVDGKIDAIRALKPCGHKAKNFKQCCPLICGKAVVLRNRKDRTLWSIDQLVTAIYELVTERQKVNNAIEVMSQGPKPPLTPLPPPPRMPHKLMPDALVDLVRALPKPEIIEWLDNNEYLIPVELNALIIDRERKHTVLFWMRVASMLGVLATILGIAVAAWKLWPVDSQGAYSGIQKSQLKKPEMRVVEAQGSGSDPDAQYANSLLKHNIFPITTGAGSFTCLGIFDKWIILPYHAVVGDLIIDGKVYEYDDVVEFKNEKGRQLELCALHIPTLQSFRDIRSHFPENISTTCDVLLVKNSVNYPRMMTPVGTISPCGLKNLDLRLVANLYTYSYPTKAGMCGGVLLKAGQVFGIHVGGDGYNGYGAALKRSYFASLQAEMKDIKPSGVSINVNTRTALHPSVWHSIVPGNKEPAILSKYDKRCECEFEKQIFSKYKGECKEIEVKELDMAVEQYAEQLRPLLPDDVWKPLTLQEAVYGIEGLDGLDLHTSAGYPYVTMGVKKKDLIPERTGPEMPELPKLAQALIDHGTKLPYVTYLKDELRPIEKVKLGKTRLIECSSLNDSVTMRMVLGRFFSVMHRNPGTVTGSAVGCDPEVHWSRFVVEIGHNNILAFDYTNFDASLGRIWFNALKRLFQKLGKNVDGLIDHVCFSTHLYRDIQYTVEGGMPSGCCGTSIFNSLINNLIVKTLVLITYKGIDLDQLKILAYGDDLMVSYPFPLDPSVLAKMGERFGLTITPPTKGGEHEVYTIDQVTFLKRGFRPDPDYPFLYHPTMKKEEIYESLRWTRNPRATQEHVTSLVHLIWHHGEQAYDEFVNIVRSTAVGKAIRITPYPILKQMWLDKF